MVSISVDAAKCNGCGECADICPGDVYDMANNKAVPARQDDCTECCNCVENCDQDAITHSEC